MKSNDCQVWVILTVFFYYINDDRGKFMHTKVIEGYLLKEKIYLSEISPDNKKKRKCGKGIIEAMRQFITTLSSKGRK